MDRQILHSDFNSFFASVECRDNPKIAKYPVAVAGDPEKRHGIILAKNEQAKRFGVQTGETIYSAQCKCENLILVEPHFEKYEKCSREAYSIYSEYTDRVEPFGLDENWLDISQPGLTIDGAEMIAHKIRRRIFAELGLTVSIGVSDNKIFAKLASDIKKPDAVTVISRDNFKEVAWRLPAEDLLFVGKRTLAVLRKWGIYTIGDIANADLCLLTTILGKHGRQLHEYANGTDKSEVAKIDAYIPAKSIGNSTTLSRDITERSEIYSVFVGLADTVSVRLRASKVQCSVIQISVKENDFACYERQAQLAVPTNITSEIAKIAMSIFEEKYAANRNKPIRSLGIHATGLVSCDTPYQLNMFDDTEKREKLKRLDCATDNLRGKFGGRIVGVCSVFHPVRNKQ